MYAIRSYYGCLLAGGPAIALAAGGGVPSLVRDIGFCILLAGILAIIFTRLRIPEIAAFLLAGVLIGPTGTGMVVITSYSIHYTKLYDPPSRGTAVERSDHWCAPERTALLLP